MKLSQEDRIDADLAKMGIQAHITHLKQEAPCAYSVVTVATAGYIEYRYLDINLGVVYLEGSIDHTKGSALDALLIERFAEMDTGVSPCHRQDNFSRKRGRIIAKGRLLKLLRTQS